MPALTREEVLGRIRSHLIEELGIDAAQIRDDSRFKEDLEADSLDLVELVMGLEEKFDVTIPEEDLEGVATVGQAVDLVLKKATEKT
jgi:acyl carrier protein